MELSRLRAWRLRRALTQEELAARAGLSKPTVNRVERGTRLARPSTVRKLATALGVDPVDLMEPVPAAGAEGGRVR
jgi:transcriptional regulator with XRE-family HTH domain